jgi:hypothetical protein
LLLAPAALVAPCPVEFALLRVAAWALLKLAGRAGGVARVTTERFALAAEGTLLRGVCPPSTEDRVGLTLAVFIVCALFSADAGTAPPTLLTAAPDVKASRDAEVTPFLAIPLVFPKLPL